MKFGKIVLINISESALDKTYWERLEKTSNKIVKLPKDDPKISQHLQDADCLLVGFFVPVTKAMIDAAPHLKYIGVLATAYGIVDVSYAKKKGIVVTNIPGYSSQAVAEFTFAVLLEHIRQIGEGKKRGKKGIYSEEGLKATEIQGKIFGVIGLGNIGTRVAQIAKGFGADVIYWSRRRKKDQEKLGVQYAPIDSLLRKSDFISLNLASTRETEQFLDKKRVQNLKKGSIVVNTAPMTLVDVDALVARLQKKDITFIFDHADEVSKEDIAKLSKFSNCIAYPPMAYITDEARIAKQEIFLTNIENFLRGRPSNRV